MLNEVQIQSINKYKISQQEKLKDELENKKMAEHNRKLMALEKQKEQMRRTQLVDAQHENYLAINEKAQSKTISESKAAIQEKNLIGEDFRNKIYEVR